MTTVYTNETKRNLRCAWRRITTLKTPKHYDLTAQLIYSYNLQMLKANFLLDWLMYTVPLGLESDQRNNNNGFIDQKKGDFEESRTGIETKSLFEQKLDSSCPKDVIF
uniref:Uncharacterized protein n=1 Tax=Strigamia maritima TaxID=126957 RepID=T1J4F6_STRMM